MQSVKVRLTGHDIFKIVANDKGVDPEVDSNLTAGNYPATRQYTVGVDVTF